MSDENQKTIDAYENGIDAYNAAMIPTVTGTLKEWVDASLALIEQAGKVLEIGSASGRDADYIESKGFEVTRTDATKSFVEYLNQNGKDAKLLNALNDDLGTDYDMIYANAVLLHFTPDQCLAVLEKAYNSLKSGGVFAFSVKEGTGSEWTSTKLAVPRYFNYWSEEGLKELIGRTDFELVLWLEGSSGHNNSNWYHVTLLKK